MADPCSADARRARIVSAALEWLGTPYRHQASCKGAGADCLGLVRGVWREAIGPEPFRLPAYTPDWAEPTGREDLLEGARAAMREIAVENAREGDVVVMRMRSRGPAKHLGLLVDMGGEEPRMIHAYSGRGVVLSSVGPSWARRIAAAFSFPE